MLNLEQRAHGMATQRLSSVYSRHLNCKDSKHFDASKEYDRLFKKYLAILNSHKVVTE